MWFNLFVFILFISTGHGYESPEEVEVGAKRSKYGPPLCRDEPERNCLCGDDGDNVCKRYTWGEKYCKYCKIKMQKTLIKQYCLIDSGGWGGKCIPDTRAEMDVGGDEESVGFGTSKIKTQENFWDIGYKSIAIFGFGLVTGSGLVALVLMNRKDPMKMSLLMDQEIEI